tara:strand:- start:1133 stop:1678 length:546 start_codon:yes stop_codon:yes gene_type:complete
MNDYVYDDALCSILIEKLSIVFPNLIIKGGAEEPFYQAPKSDTKATIHFRNNYPRSLLHELSHYCIAGEKRRKIDDFGYWYTECGRTTEDQKRFELVEARPQGLEKAMCEAIGIKFSPSLDDFSGNPPTDDFLCNLSLAYDEMLINPPPTAKKVLLALKDLRTIVSVYRSMLDDLKLPKYR